MEPVGAPSTFAAQQRRRDCARNVLGAGDALVLMASNEQVRSRDTHFPFRQDSYFFYLTGWCEPDAIFYLDAEHAALFIPEQSPRDIVWSGKRRTPAQAAEFLGLAEVLPLSQADSLIPSWLENKRALHALFDSAYSNLLNERLALWRTRIRQRTRHGARAPSILQDAAFWLDEMRLLKDESEIALMRRAGQISAQAHLAALTACREGLREYEIEALLLAQFRRHGADCAPAYESIVATGASACTLHHPAGDAVLTDGQLLLMDAACEYRAYASDITRTYPVGGKFSAAQRELYECVLSAQEAAIAAVRVGATLEAVHQAALRTLSAGLMQLGLISSAGGVEAALQEKRVLPFFMHRTSHWIGLDVHDCGDTSAPGAVPRATRNDQGDVIWQRASRVLESGMALTIEPGLYIRAPEQVDSRFHNTGIRIEDTVVVTPTGCELLTRDVPVLATEIERLMSATGAGRK